MKDIKVLEILAAHNRFWSTGRIESGIRRDMLESCLGQLESKEIIVLKGVRRSGKSTLMAQIIAHLLESGIEPTRILRINLEEPLFSPEYSIELLERVYRVFREQVQPEGKAWIFLDEVQNVPGWESWVRGRNETEDIKIFITGSSSRVLSPEIGTKLTGRQISFEVHPLSFKEYLRFNKITIRNELDYLNNRTMVRGHFLRYMKYGGFPEVVLKMREHDKELLLKNYFEDILYRDVAARQEIRDTANLRNLAVYLLTNVARPTSIYKLKNNFTISQDKTENYVSALLESYLLFQLRKFSFSLKSSLRAGFKPYAVDTGLRNRVAFSFSGDFGHLVENMIFCHLRRCFDEVYFLGNGIETDFAVKQGNRVTRYVQVWYNDPGTDLIPGRELDCFKIISQAGGQTENILITNDYEDVVGIGDVNVRCIPATKYLLLAGQCFS